MKNHLRCLECDNIIDCELNFDTISDIVTCQNCKTNLIICYDEYPDELEEEWFEMWYFEKCKF